MNNIRELIIQRVFLNQLGPLKGLCGMSYRICFFFFTCFFTILREEAFLFSSGKKGEKNNPSPHPPASLSGHCLLHL